MSIIFVPTLYKGRIKDLCPKAKVISKEVWGQCRKIPLKGYLFTVPNNIQLGVTFGFQNVYDSFLTELKEQSAACVIPLAKEERDSLKDHFDCKLHQLGAQAADISIFAGLLHQMQQYIEPIMMATQYRVTLHLSGSDVFEPYFEEKHLHIVVGSAPPGCTTEQRLQNTFFLATLEDPQKYQYSGATKYRGTEVTIDGECLGQVVGSTLYVYVPFCRDNIEVHIVNGCKFFQENLAEVWRGFCESDFYQPVVERPLVEETFAQLLADSSLESKLVTVWQEEVKALQSRIELQRRELAITMAELTRKMKLISLSRANLAKPTPTQVGWREISTHPLIERIVEVDGQVIYFTRDILIEDEAGNWRDVGSFAITVNLVDVIIWSTRITHPERIPHPHIGEGSAICFGNITSEVAKLCAEGRQVEVVLLVLRWLSEGYEPSLTLNPVEEWPLADKIVEAQ